ILQRCGAPKTMAKSIPPVTMLTPSTNLVEPPVIQTTMLQRPSYGTSPQSISSPLIVRTFRKNRIAIVTRGKRKRPRTQGATDSSALREGQRTTQRVLRGRGMALETNRGECNTIPQDFGCCPHG